MTKNEPCKSFTFLRRKEIDFLEVEGFQEETMLHRVWLVDCIIRGHDVVSIGCSTSLRENKSSLQVATQGLVGA